MAEPLVESERIGLDLGDAIDRAGGRQQQQIDAIQYRFGFLAQFGEAIAIAKHRSARDRLTGGDEYPSSESAQRTPSSTAAASCKVSANTEKQTSERQAGTTPRALTRPRVGFSPTMLLNDAGTRPEPAVSVPSAKATRPAATATAEPELDPPGMKAGSKGFGGTP